MTEELAVRERRRRKGQTLAEFAITLPILLLLLFAIVEFGRIFQAWVTLQNAARTAARYASTGQYYTDQFKLVTDGSDDATSFIPCVKGDQRGTAVDYYPNVPGDPKDRMRVYQGGIESLFATWNDGADCDPTRDDHQEMRKDMARILSIMEEARRGGAGMALEGNPLKLIDPKVVGEQPWFEVWKRPLPRSDQRSWFNVMVCSTRPRSDEVGGSTTYFKNEEGRSITTRFVTYLGETNLRDKDNKAPEPPLPVPSCLLNEIPTAASQAAGGLNNAGKPWLDPGGPGDSVSVVVSFNHPLITPLPRVTEYIPMQARRTAIVESFRSTRAVLAIDLGGGTGGGLPTLTPTWTYTPSITPSPTQTPSGTPRPTNTATATDIGPFDCSKLSLGDVSLFGNQVSVDISNNNKEATYLKRVRFLWSKEGFPEMFLSQMELDGAPHWIGADGLPPTDTNNNNEDPSNPRFADVSELDRTISPFQTATWTATFNGGPNALALYFKEHHYDGTQFYLHNPRTGVDCVLTINVAQPPGGPSTPTHTPTVTPTPDCASASLRIQFERFEQFGLVRLLVINTSRNQFAPFVGFSINWVQRAPGTLRLARVTTVAPLGQPGSVTVWEAPAPQDANPPTAHTEPAWVRNYVFNPNSTTALYLDFDGIGSTLDAIGVSPTDFNGSRFIIYCGRNQSGWGGGGGGGSTGEIILSEIPTPAPTNTRGPTNTPRPTDTPRPTNTVGPTKPPTLTPVPTITKPPTLTFTPTTPPPPTKPPLTPIGGRD